MVLGQKMSTKKFMPGGCSEGLAYFKLGQGKCDKSFSAMISVKAEK